MTASRKSLAFNLVALVVVACLTPRNLGALLDITLGALVGVAVLWAAQPQGREAERRAAEPGRRG